MKMKKVLAFGLSAAMVFSLAACSGGGNGEPQQLGNFFDGIALIVIEVDHSAVLRRQGLHGGKDGGGLRQLSARQDLRVLQGERPPLRHAGHVTGPVEGGPDQPRLLVLIVPELWPGGQQLQKDVLDHVLRVGGGRQPGHGDPQQHPAVGFHSAADGFVGTKRSQGPQLLSPITRVCLPKLFTVGKIL